MSKFRAVNDKYILDNDGKPIVCEDTLTWARWMERTQRHVCQTYIGKIYISTVFLGLDHSWTAYGPPVLFETMIFKGKHDDYQMRYETWEQAEVGHEIAVAMVNKTCYGWFIKFMRLFW